MGFAAAAVAVSAATSIIGGAAKAKAQKQAAANSMREGALRAELSKMAADDVRKSASATAAKILDNARVFRSTQVAAQAASGVIVGQGSAQQVLDLTTGLAHADAMVALYEGAGKASNIEASGDFEKQALDNRAAEQISASKASLLNGYLGAASSVASFGMQGGFSSLGTTTAGVTPSIATDARGLR